jgi:hypothetical protein
MGKFEDSATLSNSPGREVSVDEHRTISKEVHGAIEEVKYHNPTVPEATQASWSVNLASQGCLVGPRIIAAYKAVPIFVVAF